LHEKVKIVLPRKLEINGVFTLYTAHTTLLLVSIVISQPGGDAVHRNPIHVNKNNSYIEKQREYRLQSQMKNTAMTLKNSWTQ